MGLASGFLEPLESTSIFLIQAAVIDLVNLMPTPGEGHRHGPTPGRRVQPVVRDPVRSGPRLSHPALPANQPVSASRCGTMCGAWKSPTASKKMALFEERAGLPDYKYGLFSRDSWLSVLEGQGLTPRAHDRLAESLPPRRSGSQAGRPEDADRQQCRDDDAHHADFLARYAPGRPGRDRGRCQAWRWVDERANQQRRGGGARRGPVAVGQRAAHGPGPAGRRRHGGRAAQPSAPWRRPATLPALEALHTLPGIDESGPAARRAAPSPWARTSPTCRARLRPSSTPTAPMARRSIAGHSSPIWLKARGLGLNVALEDFSLTAAAAKQGRMLMPGRRDGGLSAAPTMAIICRPWPMRA
jgi:hypothetical protein